MKLKEQFLFLMFERILKYTSTFFILSLVVRKLDSTVFGSFAFSQNLIEIFGVFFLFGTESIFPPIFNKNQDNSDLVTQSIRLRGILSLSAILLATTTAYFYFPKYKDIIIIFILTKTLQNFNIFEYFYQARGESRLIN